MKFGASRVLALCLAFLVVSLAGIAAVFAGLTYFRWVVYVCVPVGAVAVIFFSVLAMTGGIENDIQRQERCAECLIPTRRGRLTRRDGEVSQ